jgi:hypothetical protein
MLSLPIARDARCLSEFIRPNKQCTQVPQGGHRAFCGARASTPGKAASSGPHAGTTHSPAVNMLVDSPLAAARARRTPHASTLTAGFNLETCVSLCTRMKCTTRWMQYIAARLRRLGLELWQMLVVIRFSRVPGGPGVTCRAVGHAGGYRANLLAPDSHAYAVRDALACSQALGQHALTHCQSKHRQGSTASPGAQSTTAVTRAQRRPRHGHVRRLGPSSPATPPPPLAAHPTPQFDRQEVPACTGERQHCRGCGWRRPPRQRRAASVCLSVRTKRFRRLVGRRAHQPTTGMALSSGSWTIPQTHREGAWGGPLLVACAPGAVAAG